MNKREFHFSDISLSCLLRYLLKHLWMIVASALILAMCASLYVSLLYTPIYQASTTYAVSARRTSYTSSSNVSSAKETAGVLAEMLQSNLATQNIRKSSGALSGFSGTVTATQVSGSNFIVIQVTDTSPETAFLALLAIDDLLPTYTGYVSSNSVVQVIRNPSVSSTPINQVNSSNLVLLGGVLGAAAMSALLCWFFLLQDTVQTRSGARHQLDSQIIATIYEEKRQKTLSSLLRRQESGPLQVFAPTTSFGYAEQINSICSRIMQESATNGSKVFLFTGVGENEGKTTVAGNVAAALSIMGKRVALLDCDLRNPSMNKFLGGQYASVLPLNKLLSMPLNKDSLVQCIQHHEKLGLYMLFPSGPERRCAELLSGSTMDEVLKQLRLFDYVIIDTPPASFSAETEALANKADAAILVVRKNTSSAADINDTARMLRNSGSNYLGCVLNRMTHAVTEGSGYGYGYGYGHGYGYGYGYGQSHSKKSAKHSGKKGG